MGGSALRADARFRVPTLLFGATMLTVAISRSGEYRAIDGLVIPVAVLAAGAWPSGLLARRAPGVAHAWPDASRPSPAWRARWAPRAGR